MNKQVLILGWGNPGRGDDGLGPAFIEAIDQLSLPGVAAESDYQLQIEAASEIAGCMKVVFVDADRRGPEPFWIERLSPESGLSFSTHSVSPAAVLALARDLFQAEPEAWLLGIRGYEFDEFGERLSGRAQVNLEQALHYVKSAVQGDGFAELRPTPARLENCRDRVGDLCQTTSP